MRGRAQLPSSHLAAMALVGLVLAAEAVALPWRLAHASAPYDDAFITFRYARNWAEGLGFAYNPGQPYLGTTAPAYAVLLGVLQWLFGHDPEWFANGLSGLAMATMGWFGFRLVLEDYGPVPAALAGLSIALNPMMISTWGGEWILAAAAMSAGFYYYRMDALGRAATAFSLAILFRSEAALGVAPVFATLLWQRRPGAVRAVATSAAIGLAWVVVALVVVGQVIPSTLGTKLAHGRSGLFANLLWGLASGGRQFILADWRMGLIVLLAWHGGLVALVKGGVWRLIAFWVGVHLLFYTWLNLPFYHWYLVPIAFGISIFAGIGVAAIGVYLHALLPSPSVARGLTTALGVVLLATVVVSEARSSRAFVRAKPDPREQLYNHVGGWVAEHTPPTASVSYLEIGRLGYFSRRPIIDLMGLVTPEVASHVADQDLRWAIHHYKPDYYLYTPAFVWSDPPINEPWFQEAYRKIEELSVPTFDWRVSVYQRQPGAPIPSAPVMQGAQLRGGAIAGELLPGVPETQTFRAAHDNLWGLALNLATFARPNKGGMVFRVEQLDPAQTIYEERFDMADVADNQWRTFRFPMVAASANHRFRLTIEALDSRPGNAITIHASPRDQYPDGERTSGGKPVAGDLMLKLLYAADPAGP